MNNIERQVCKSVQKALDEIKPDCWQCEERKQAKGTSSIDKPVDLHIIKRSNGKQIVAVEVANVNTTQLVSECVRLYFDCLPIKLLVLHKHGNVPPNGKAQCEKTLCALYSQKDSMATPSRVVWDEASSIKQALNQLLYGEL